MIIPKNFKSQKLSSKLTKYSGHFFPHKRLPQNVWIIQKNFKSQKMLHILRGIISNTKDYHKKCDHPKIQKLLSKLTKCSGHFFHSKDRHKMCDHPKFPENVFKSFQSFQSITSQKTATKCVIIAAGQTITTTRVTDVSC